MRLNHNMMSMNVYRNYTKDLAGRADAISKISSGIKLNSAKDNPNALGRSELFRMQIRGLQAAQRNLQDSVSMVQAVDGALSTVSDSLCRLKELATQASNGTNTSEDLRTIQNEINSIKDHINSVAKETEFNGIKLIGDDDVIDNNNPRYLKVVSGTNVGENIKIPKFDISIDKLAKDGALSLKDLDITDINKISQNLKLIDDSIKEVSKIRSKYGALQSRLETSVNNIDFTVCTSEKAESYLRDADLAEEMMDYARNNILVESSNAMMVQTNNFPQDALRILERLK